MIFGIFFTYITRNFFNALSHSLIYKYIVSKYYLLGNIPQIWYTFMIEADRIFPITETEIS